MDKLKKVWAFVDSLPGKYMGLPLWTRILCWAAVLVFVAFMAGCATNNGVQMNADEAKACAAETCSVWTERELRALIQKALEEGWKMREKAGGTAI